MKALPLYGDDFIETLSIRNGKRHDILIFISISFTNALSASPPSGCPSGLLLFVARLPAAEIHVSWKQK
jgi:hypothetical protein